MAPPRNTTKMRLVMVHVVEGEEDQITVVVEVGIVERGEGTEIDKLAIKSVVVL